MATTKPALRQLEGTNLSTDLIRSFSKTCKPLCRQIAEARRFAAAEHDRVDAYLLPVFQKYGFRNTTGGRTGDLGPIVARNDIYLCDDDELCAKYFDECDQVHRDNGFTGPEGHSPELIADVEVLRLEGKLISEFSIASGVNFAGGSHNIRQRILALLLEMGTKGVRN